MQQQLFRQLLQGLRRQLRQGLHGQLHDRLHRRIEVTARQTIGQQPRNKGTHYLIQERGRSTWTGRRRMCELEKLADRAGGEPPSAERSDAPQKTAGSTQGT